MPDDQKPSANLGVLILRPVEHALAAAEREALAIGVPTHDVIQMLMNHLASIVACVEPPGVRAELTKDIMTNLGGLIRQHVERRYIITPKTAVESHNAV